MKVCAYLFSLCVTSSLFAIVANQDVSSLCASSKSENKCMCQYKTDGRTHFPELYADCRWIDLALFPRAEQFPDDLFYLDLSHNSLDGVHGQFGSQNLLELILSYNKIGQISHAFLNTAPNLERLDLSHNEISTLESDAFEGLGKLITLDLSFNKLTVLTDKVLTPLVNLQNLNLGYNSKLGEFFAESYNIFEDDFGLTPNISRLNLERTGLKEIKNDFFGDTKLLVDLSMADNYFNEIPPIPTSVRYFDFSGNNVSMLAVRHLNYHSMKVLKLNRLKNLDTIDRYAFYNMQALEELYLENCPRLREFNSLAFGLINPGDDTTLKKLSLARSGLTKLNDTYFHLLRKLDYVDLQNNPWICDCGIVWMHLLNGTLSPTDHLRCVSPTNLRNKRIMSLTARNLPNCLVSARAMRLQKLLIPILGVMIILLLCLIIYLIYMGPLLFRNYRGIGPESPYQEVTVLREYN